MTTTLDSKETSETQRTQAIGPIAVGTVMGAAAVGCCSVGIASGLAVGMGAGAGFYSLNEISPVGDRPVLFFGALLFTVAVAWGVARWQTRGMPAAVAKPATRRVIGAAAIAGAGSWFVMMQIVIPLAFIFGWADMGQWFASS